VSQPQQQATATEYEHDKLTPEQIKTLARDGCWGATVRDGVNGWSLVLSMWNEENGVVRLDYERAKGDGSGEIEKAFAYKAQPHGPSHVGWYSLGR
jgi:hypothetical protein